MYDLIIADGLGTFFGKIRLLILFLIRFVRGEGGQKSFYDTVFAEKFTKQS